MEMLEKIRRLWEHAVWADTELLEALRQADGISSEVISEYAHILGTEEVWLARVQKRPPRAAVWPEVSIPQAQVLSRETKAAYADYLSALVPGDLDAVVSYKNSAGKEFTNSVGDILLHVVLHGQYHRGKVNLLLRQLGFEPAPTDYIAFVRGAPAATRHMPRSGSSSAG